MLTEVNLQLNYANGVFTELVLKKVTQGRICCMPVCQFLQTHLWVFYKEAK